MSAITDRKLRVLFVTEDDPLYVIRFFEVFFDEYPKDEIEIVGVSVQEAFHEPKHKTAKRILRFYGPVDFVRLLSRYIKVKLRGDSIVKLAKDKNLPIVEAPLTGLEALAHPIANVDLVIGLAAHGQARAYPLKVLGGPQREIINDRLGDEPFAVNW